MKRKIIVALISIIVLISLLLIYYNDTDKIYYDLYEKAKDMIIEGKEKYANIANGGKYGKAVEIKKGDSTEFVFLIEDKNINSLEKVINYLQEVYTNNLTKKIYTKLGYFEKNRKLYKDAADSIFVVDYKSAEIESIKINKFKKEAIIILKVNYVIGVDNSKRVDYKVIKVKFNKINGEYIYKLNTIIR